MDSDKLLVVCTNSAGDRKLYSILRSVDGQVWDWKHEKFVEFANDKYLDYVVDVPYKGGDVYLLVIPKRASLTKCAIVYLQKDREPSIYDEIIRLYGTEDCPIPKEMPDKHKPIVPFSGEPASRPRSKVPMDAYSDS